MENDKKITWSNALCDILFPFRVYEIQQAKVAGAAPLRTLEGGFFDKADAEFYIRKKSELTGKKYAVYTKEELDNIAKQGLEELL